MNQNMGDQEGDKKTGSGHEKIKSDDPHPCNDMQYGDGVRSRPTVDNLYTNESINAGKAYPKMGSENGNTYEGITNDEHIYQAMHESGEETGPSVDNSCTDGSAGPVGKKKTDSTKEQKAQSSVACSGNNTFECTTSDAHIYQALHNDEGEGDESNEFKKAGQKQVFEVVASVHDDNTRLGLSGVYSLKVTATSIELIDPSTEDLIYSWRKRFIRSYGFLQTKSKFYLQTGSRCEAGNSFICFDVMRDFDTLVDIMKTGSNGPPLDASTTGMKILKKTKLCNII